MTPDDLATIATVRARVERIGERLTTTRLPPGLMAEIQSVVMALRALETKGER